MARKKEPDLESKNRDKIIQIAKALFLKQGVEATTMNDIAREVGMSKSTLYVYFKSKDEVTNYLALQAMEYFKSELERNITEDMNSRERFFGVCSVLVSFQRSYPLHFHLLMDEICVDEKVMEQDEVLYKIYKTGEAVNQFLFTMLGSLMKAADQRAKFLKIMSMWAQIFGLVTLADQKEKYLMLTAGITKEEFLNNNFEELFSSLNWKE